MKRLIKFIGVSGIGWLIDIIIYSLLTSIFNINVNIANMISSFVGVSFVFITSTRKLFINNSVIDIRFKYIIYIVYQVILIYCASYVMLIFKNYLIDIDFIFKYIDIIVKIMITPFTMIINFIVMKYLIEKI